MRRQEQKQDPATEAVELKFRHYYYDLFTSICALNSVTHQAAAVKTMSLYI